MFPRPSAPGPLHLASGIRHPAFFALLLLAASRAAAGPAEDYLDAQLRVVKGLEGSVSTLVEAADLAATRLIGGGRLLLAGDRGIIAEVNGRAGGPCSTQVVSPGKTLVAKGDVVLFSESVPTDEAESAWMALTVLFAPAERPDRPQWQLKANVRPVLVDIGPDACLLKLPSGERCVSKAAPALAIAEWAFVAELIGACRRQGKQLAIYLSIHLDEGRKRFERTRGLMFEPGLKPEPVPAGQFAKAFLGHVRTSLEGMRRDDGAAIRKAAAWLREAKAAGRKTVRHLYGHMPPHEVGSPGDPPIFTDTVTGPVGGQGAEWVQKNLHEGDAYLLIGYQQNEEAMAAAASAVGARSIFMTSLPPGAEQAKDPLHLYVNPHWPVTDGCLELPGYDVKACPLSAIMGLACYYAICAEAIAAP